MGQLVCMGAMLKCTFGAAPSTLTVTPENLTNATSKPAATIMDFTPIKNIAPFGMCSSLANPQVAAATSAASGALTPQPCVPNTLSPWAVGSPTVLIKGKPALNNTSKLICAWGGVISVEFAGQVTVNIP